MFTTFTLFLLLFLQRSKRTKFLVLLINALYSIAAREGNILFIHFLMASIQIRWAGIPRDNFEVA